MRRSRFCTISIGNGPATTIPLFLHAADMVPETKSDTNGSCCCGGGGCGGGGCGGCGSVESLVVR